MLDDDPLAKSCKVLEELEEGPGFGFTSPVRNSNAYSQANKTKLNKKYVP